MDSKISVIVPIYKVEKYLNQCIESIVKQTYENLEIILVDDGSPDSCPAICDEWAKKDGRIVVIHQVNAGLPSARNAGLRIASGDFISFIDSDDYIDKSLYKDVLNFFDDNELDIVSFGFYEVCNDKTTVVDIQDGYMDRNESIKHLLTWDGKVRSFVWNKIYRASHINNCCFYEDLRYGEDTPFVFTALTNSVKCFQINKPYYYYIRRKDSLVGEKYTSNKLLSIDALKRVLDECIIKNLPYVELAESSIAWNAYILLRLMVQTVDYKVEYSEDYFTVLKEIKMLSNKVAFDNFSFTNFIKFVLAKYCPEFYTVLLKR